MPDNLYIGNFSKGLKNSRQAFNIDNDAFPTLFNSYVWRGRVKRKRGTFPLARLSKQVQLVLAAPLPWQFGPLPLVTGEGNIFRFLGLATSPTVITGITQETDAVITIVGHTYLPGEVVNIIDVTGMTEINGLYGYILSIGVNTITVNIDTTAFTAYTGGGQAYLADGPSIVPGSVTLNDGVNTYTEQSIPDGTLRISPSIAVVGTINYSTGTVIIPGLAGPLTGTFTYYPGLPVLGLEDFVSNQASAKFPLLLAFDTTYAYQLNQTGAPFFYNVSYYKNTNNPLIWSNSDSNQFWSTNYQSAFWVTNNKPGLHFVNGTYISGSGTNIITFDFTSGGNPFTTLVFGDELFFNQWNPPDADIINIEKSTSPTIVTANNSFIIGQKVIFTDVEGMTELNQGLYTITAATSTTFSIDVDSSAFKPYIGNTGTSSIDEASSNTTTLNYANGIVTTVTGTPGRYVVTFLSDGEPDSQIAQGTGIAFLLTNSIVGQDGIRWYDGDPTQQSGLPSPAPPAPPTLPKTLGWSNFNPPLTDLVVIINDQIEAKYYLVGALAILPFKDRLLFFGPQIQSITDGVSQPVIQRPLQDTVIYSWNGTPYYNSLVPTNNIISGTSTETFDNTAYFVDQAGKGGFQSAGIQQPIVTVLNNEDVILVGFGGQGKKTRLVSTGNDLLPFLFYLINNEMPSSSTFSGVNFDKGALEIGQYGLTVTTQQSCSRIDLDIPDEIFKIQSLNNNPDNTNDSAINRVNAVRDFYRQWVYFTYPIGDGKGSNGSWVYPVQSLLYNYEDNTWSILRENYTHQGTFRRANKYTWLTLPFKTWASWREPWNAGSSIALFPSIVGGNPEGYVVVKGEGTREAPTGYISALEDDGFGLTQVTAINHCVNSQSVVQGLGGDYLSFDGNIGLVIRTIDKDNFVVDIPFTNASIITAIAKGTVTKITTKNNYFVGQTVKISLVFGMTQLNGNTYTIIASTPTSITINVDSTAFTTYTFGGITALVTYIGTGQYSRLAQPLIQTKQFPMYWEQGKKCRLGVQRYLLDTTQSGQITVNINLSQNPDSIWNDGPIIPNNNVLNSGLEYSQLVYTCPESTNLGLTPFNVNLQMPTAIYQDQIWHRLNTSLIGDSIQLGFTLNDVQMRDLTIASSEITISGIHLQTYPSQQLA